MAKVTITITDERNGATNWGIESDPPFPAKHQACTSAQSAALFVMRTALNKLEAIDKASPPTTKSDA